MFPDGWPGKGLLILRLVTGAFLIQDGVTGLIGEPHREPMILLLVSAIAEYFFSRAYGRPSRELLWRSLNWPLPCREQLTIRGARF